MVRGNTVNELVDALSVPQQNSSTVYSAVVANVDNEGVVWVHVEGSSKVTPTASRVAEVKQGDHISVEWRNNKLYISGNYTTPATDDTTANMANATAVNAQQAVTALNTVVANTIIADNARFTELEADTAKIHNLTAQEIQATVGYIDDLTTGNVTASDIVADHATIEDLDVQSMSAATAYIGALTAGNVTAQNIIADHGTIGSLDTTYAEIDLANVNNAWIQNGVIKNGAIADAQIIGVSANKLTAGTIDASNITVTNLNASNITTGSITVDGITIDVTNNEASIDGSYIDEGTITLSGLAQEVTDKIDGAIETFTGNVVPTLNNYPASSWTTSAIKDTHIGDVYYVINAGNQADGYCYRFAKSGSTYQWVLIKDSDVTAALGRLTTAEGKITGLESFESTTSSWITETDEELSSLKTNVTSLTTRVGDAEDEIETKVDTSTFNELSQTVGENSASITTLTTITTNNGLTSSTNITNTVNSVSQTATSNSTHLSQLTTTLGTNADGTTKAGDIVHKVSDIDQDLDSITTRVGKTEVQIKGSYATSSTAKGTTAKVATIVPAVTGWELYTGATITVKFTNENTVTSPTLNVNSTGAKGIRNYSGGTLSEAERQWPAGATMSFVYDGTYWRIQDSTELTRLKTAESSITQTATSIESVVAGNTTYTKPDGTTGTSTIGTTVQQTANNVLIKATENDTTAAQGGQHLIQSLINVAPSGVTISADKVNIEGAAIFTGNGRLSQTSLDNAYEEHGAVADLVTDLASSSGTTVINGGHIDTGSITIGQVNNLQTSIDNAAWTLSVSISSINYETNTATLVATVYKYGAVQSSGFTLQWYKNGTAISGQTSATLSNVTADALYTCVAT